MIRRSLPLAEEAVNAKRFLAASLLENSYTPDAELMSANYDFVPVFVYGPEKVGFSEDLSVTGAIPVGAGYTCQNNLYMMVHQKGYPIVYAADPSNGLNIAAARVYGHLFLVTPQQLMDLDAKYQNGTFFTRQRRWVHFSTFSDRGHTGAQYYQTHALTYFAIPDMWKEEFKTGRLIMMPSKTVGSKGPLVLFSTKDDKGRKPLILQD